MSFKFLNDAQRRRALLPFLNAANLFDGACVVVVVHKDLKRMSTSPSSVEIWKSIRGLKGNWRPSAFEAMARVAHFFSLLVAEFSRPHQHVTWITDEDDIVANDDRLTDIMDLAASMAGLYADHPLGEFAMNSTQVDEEERYFEDFVAIPDLVAGAFAEVVNVWSRDPRWYEGGDLFLMPDKLTRKANIVSTWFCDASPALKRAVVLVDRHDDKRFLVEHMDIVK